jgi:hypothetical protein
LSNFRDAGSFAAPSHCESLLGLAPPHYNRGSVPGQPREPRDGGVFAAILMVSAIRIFYSRANRRQGGSS